jgi:hypothetical protein
MYLVLVENCNDDRRRENTLAFFFFFSCGVQLAYYQKRMIGRLGMRHCYSVAVTIGTETVEMMMIVVVS